MAKRWYIVHAYSNFERKVADAIKEKVAQTKLEHLFDDVIVPTEKVVEIRRGRKVDAERKFFPGYVLVKCELTDPVYSLIKNTPKVTGFLGADKSKPVPIPDAEAERIKAERVAAYNAKKAAKPKTVAKVRPLLHLSRFSAVMCCVACIYDLSEYDVDLPRPVVRCHLRSEALG